MKSLIGGLAALTLTVYAPAAQAADCQTLQEYFAAYSEAQYNENQFNYADKNGEALEQYQRCISNVHRLYGGQGSEAVAQAARDCELEYNTTLSNVEDEYWLIRNEAMITSIEYHNYLNLTLAEGLQCF